MILLKYPSGIKRGTLKTNNLVKSTSRVNYGSRGMTLEKDLDQTNTYYLKENIAVIHKKPTPITVVKVDYPSRNKAKISEAYYKTPSTSDYNGIYKGKYIDFEAKETKNKTRFPFINIHSHQVEHMRQCHQNGGIVFLIIRFSAHNEVMLYPIERFLVHWDEYILNDGKKSIPYQTIKSESILIQEKFNPRYDYLRAVDEFFLKER